MTVGELMKILQAFPEDMEVLWGDKVEPERSDDIGVVEVCRQTCECWPIPSTMEYDDGDEDLGEVIVIWPEGRWPEGRRF